jgi:hypothetical protein
MTTSVNPWNEAYKLAVGKRNTSTQITTLRKPDGSLTVHIKEIPRLMLEYFTPTDREHDDKDYHKQVRTQAQQPSNMSDDRDFMIEEIRNVVESTHNKKAPEDGITGDICKETFNTFPKFITAMHNGSLRYGVFQKRWKRAKSIPIIKPGKKNSDET